MTTTPTGRLLDGRLELTRRFKASIDDVWASITEPERTARWFGHWSGEGRPGATVRLTLDHGDEQTESDLTIIACEPPRRLEVDVIDEEGRWRLEARLAEDGGVTTLTFVHHLDPETDVTSVGPGWEYTLALLTALVTDAPEPNFDDYYPAMAEYYKGLTTAD